MLQPQIPRQCRTIDLLPEWIVTTRSLTTGHLLSSTPFTLYIIITLYIIYIYISESIYLSIEMCRCAVYCIVIWFIFVYTMDSATFTTSHCPNGSSVQGLRAGRWCCCWLVVNFARHHICKWYKAWVLSGCQLKKKCSTDYNEFCPYLFTIKKMSLLKIIGNKPVKTLRSIYFVVA